METMPHWQLSTITDKRRRPLCANLPATQTLHARKSRLYPPLPQHTLQTLKVTCRRPRQLPLLKAKDRQYTGDYAHTAHSTAPYMTDRAVHPQYIQYKSVPCNLRRNAQTTHGHKRLTRATCPYVALDWCDRKYSSCRHLSQLVRCALSAIICHTAYHETSLQTTTTLAFSLARSRRAPCTGQRFRPTAHTRTFKRSYHANPHLPPLPAANLCPVLPPPVAKTRPSSLALSRPAPRGYDVEHAAADSTAHRHYHRHPGGRGHAG
eukprot:scaffold13472_cov129-Isochrysis_galbana.AAC.5